MAKEILKQEFLSQKVSSCNCLHIHFTCFKIHFFDLKYGTCFLFCFVLQVILVVTSEDYYLFFGVIFYCFYIMLIIFLLGISILSLPFNCMQRNEVFYYMELHAWTLFSKNSFWSWHRKSLNQKYLFNCVLLINKNIVFSKKYMLSSY